VSELRFEQGTFLIHITSVFKRSLFNDALRCWCYITSVIDEWYKVSVEWRWQEGNWSIWRRMWPSDELSNINILWTELESNPDLCGGKQIGVVVEDSFIMIVILKIRLNCWKLKHKCKIYARFLQVSFSLLFTIPPSLRRLTGYFILT